TTTSIFDCESTIVALVFIFVSLYLNKSMYLGFWMITTYITNPITLVFFVKGLNWCVIFKERERCWISCAAAAYVWKMAWHGHIFPCFFFLKLTTYITHNIYNPLNGDMIFNDIDPIPNMWCQCVILVSLLTTFTICLHDRKRRNFQW
ncbi:hypothetical protein ACJX0J_039952, partial [Zea mays]